MTLRITYYILIFTYYCYRVISLIKYNSYGSEKISMIITMRENNQYDVEKLILYTIITKKYNIHLE